MGLHKTDENFEVSKRENSVILLEENYKEKYEGFDPNTDVADKNDLRWTTLNWSYYLRGNDEKIQLNYVWKHERADPSNNDTWIVQYQRVF